MFSVRVIKQGALAISMTLALSGAAYAAEEHSHDHGASQAKLVLNHGKKWQTDDALRKGMENIRAAIAADKKAIHAGKLTEPQYEALAKKVNGEVAYVVQNCKLDKQADEQLHIVLGEVMAGAEAMEGKEKGVDRRAGVERVAKALNAYGRYFDHKGWKAL